MRILLLVIIGILLSSPVCAGLDELLFRYDMQEFSRQLADVNPAKSECIGLYFAIDLLSEQDNQEAIPSFTIPQFMPLEDRLNNDNVLAARLRELITAGQKDDYSPQLTGILSSARCGEVDVIGKDFSACDRLSGPSEMYDCVKVVAGRQQ